MNETGWVYVIEYQEGICVGKGSLFPEDIVEMNTYLPIVLKQLPKHLGMPS